MREVDAGDEEPAGSEHHAAKVVDGEVLRAVRLDRVTCSLEPGKESERCADAFW